MSDGMSAGDIVATIGNTLKLKRIPNYPRECKGVKQMIEMGYSPEEIISTYMSIKADKFWQDKYLRTGYVATNIESRIGPPKEKVDWDKWAEEHGGI